MNFVANSIRFPAVQSFENRLRFDKVTESLKVGTFLRHIVVRYSMSTYTGVTSCQKAVRFCPCTLSIRPTRIVLIC